MDKKNLIIKLFKSLRGEKSFIGLLFVNFTSRGTFINKEQNKKKEKIITTNHQLLFELSHYNFLKIIINQMNNLAFYWAKGLIDLHFSKLIFL
jgi:hypothetical protein